VDCGIIYDMAGIRKLTNLRVVDNALRKYFADCDAKQEPYGVYGLALALGVHGELVRDISNGHDMGEEWRDIRISAKIKEATLRIRASVETRLLAKSSVGAMFWLKNCAKWADKLETDVTSGGKTLQAPTVSSIAPPDTLTVSPLSGMFTRPAETQAVKPE